MTDDGANPRIPTKHPNRFIYALNNIDWGNENIRFTCWLFRLLWFCGLHSELQTTIYIILYQVRWKNPVFETWDLTSMSVDLSPWFWKLFFFIWKLPDGMARYYDDDDVNAHTWDQDFSFSDEFLTKIK